VVMNSASEFLPGSIRVPGKIRRYQAEFITMRQSLACLTAKSLIGAHADDASGRILAENPGRQGHRGADRFHVAGGMLMMSRRVSPVSIFANS
jgi:hypothetical protein